MCVSMYGGVTVNMLFAPRFLIACDELWKGGGRRSRKVITTRFFTAFDVFSVSAGALKAANENSH